MPQHDRLRPLNELTVADVAPLVGILFDIDDTVTLHGRIVPEAFAAMARARAAGLRLVPVTGRPGGWVDHIARMWPVDGVVGENGGLWYYLAPGPDGVPRLERRFVQAEAERDANLARLAAVRAAVLAEVPGCGIASDQPYRELDLAVDFREDVAPLGEAAIDRIVGVFDRFGATSKVSSIHVNGWFGTFDKLSGFERLAADLGLPAGADRWAYVGDSANDAPMFAHFGVSVGVANVDAFLPRIPRWPRFRAAGEGGFGFAELVDRILLLRAAAAHADAAAERCVAGAPRLSETALAAALEALPGWALVDGGTALHRSYRFGDYTRTVAFVNALAALAEAEDHHPDLGVHYGRVEVRWGTHDAGGVTRNDLLCARRSDALAARG